ncbi:MarR family winged helix-turn-helix transcriptional regulator [Enterococcus larvae]|nr:MarR family transcriptional regulator [Enterococcus larvae]
MMTFGMENSLSEQLYSINNLQQEYIQHRLKRIDLNTQQARTLNYIFSNSGTIQKELAIYLGKQDATITNLLKTLEKKHYITREIPENNERQKKLYLTDKGITAVQEIQAIFIELEEALSSLLTKSEQATTKQLLKKIQQHFPK